MIELHRLKYVVIFFQTIISFVQSKLLMSMIEKYRKKYIYLRKKDRKLFIIWDYYHSIIMECQKNNDFFRQKIKSTI